MRMHGCRQLSGTSTSSEMSRIDRVIRASTVALLVGGVAVSIGLLARVLYFAKYGFDFTDEGFYLLSLASPSKFWPLITQFGWVYHPAYLAVGGDFVALRMLNAAVIFGFSILLSYFCLLMVLRGAKSPLYVSAFLSICFGSTSFVFFNRWLLTPSYNSLALQSLLLVAMGLLICESNDGRKKISGAFMIGLGGWLAFMAKPTSAAALAILVVLYFLLRQKRSVDVLLVATSVAGTLAVGTILFIDGSFGQFFVRVASAVDFARTLNSGHDLKNIVRLDPVQISAGGVLALLCAIIGYLLGLICLSRPVRQLFIVCICFSAFLLGWAVLFSFVIFYNPNWLTSALLYRNNFLTYVIVSLAIVCIAIPMRRRNTDGIILALLFFALPYVFAMGTNGNYWQQGSLAGIFWVLGAVLLLGPSINAANSVLVLMPFALSAQAVTAAMLLRGLEYPYRQPSALVEYHAVADVGRFGDRVVVHGDFARYINDARLATQSAGLESETAIIDLSGQSPGLIFAVGARSLGLPWLVGGLPGSAHFASRVLETVPCEDLAKAWVLTEPGGPRSLPLSVLDSLHANFPIDYRLVASWAVASGAGGFQMRGLQNLYMPVAVDATLSACKKARFERPPVR